MAASPDSSSVADPSTATGRSSRSTLTTAMSDIASVPTTRPGSSVPSDGTTTKAVTSATRCAFVAR